MYYHLQFIVLSCKKTEVSKTPMPDSISVTDTMSGTPIQSDTIPLKDSTTNRTEMMDSTKTAK